MYLLTNNNILSLNSSRLPRDRQRLSEGGLRQASNDWRNSFFAIYTVFAVSAACFRVFLSCPFTSEIPKLANTLADLLKWGIYLFCHKTKNPRPLDTRQKLRLDLETPRH